MCSLEKLCRRKGLREMKRLRLNAMAAVLMASLALFFTCCSRGSAASDTTGEHDKKTAVGAESIKTVEDGQMEELIGKEMEKIGFTGIQTENLIITVSDTIPGILVSEAETIEDEIGKGIRITDEKGMIYDVYIDKTGNVFGIKEEETGEYIFMVYE